MRPKELFELPGGSFAGAMYQPLAGYRVWYRHNQLHRDKPWWRLDRREFLDDTGVIRLLKHRYDTEIDPEDLARWKDAASVWFPPVGPVAWGYMRFSHESLASSGLSFERQVGILREYYPRRFGESDVRSGPIFCDAMASGRFIGLRGRRGGWDLMRFCKPGDHIMFARLDRGVRSAKDLAFLFDRHWDPRKITPHFLDLGADLSTVEGRLFLAVASSLAENESNWRSDRGRAVAKRLRERGRPTNQHAPYGWKIRRDPNGKRLVPDPHARALMRYIEKLHDEDGLSWEKIRQRLRDSLREQYAYVSNNPAALADVWSVSKVRRLYQAWKQIQATGQAAAKPT